MSFPPSVHAHLEANTVKLNQDIVQGLAVKHMKDVERYISEVFDSLAQSFPPGLKYHGCKRCTPEEEWREATRKRNNRCTFDVARSDLYLMRYDFSYNGGPIWSRYLYLPFVSRGGIIHISGARFGITPILADRVISIGLNNVFLRLIKAKITINREAVFYKANGIQESVYVAWSTIYNTPNKSAAAKNIKGNCTLVHYLFCKYGFEETFKRFANCTPKVLDENAPLSDYPTDQWVICESRQIMPKGVKRQFYEPCKIKLAIPKEQYTAMTKSLVAGFFYVADLFPNRIYVDSIRNWMILMGHLIWNDENIGHGRLIDDMNDHIQSLDYYLDALNKDKLGVLGYKCNDIYELFGIIIQHFNGWLLGPEDRVSTMYDKELQILYYVCLDITSAISNFGFKLQAAMKGPLDENKIRSLMNKYIKPGIVFRITRDHGEVSPQSTPGDNMATKITALLVPQSKSSKSRGRRERMSLTDPSKRLHASIAEVGGYANLPKGEPTGRSRVNPTLQITPNGMVIRREIHRELIDQTQAQFRRLSAET